MDIAHQLHDADLQAVSTKAEPDRIQPVPLEVVRVEDGPASAKLAPASGTSFASPLGRRGQQRPARREGSNDGWARRFKSIASTSRDGLAEGRAFDREAGPGSAPSIMVDFNSEEFSLGHSDASAGCESCSSLVPLLAASIEPAAALSGGLSEQPGPTTEQLEGAILYEVDTAGTGWASPGSAEWKVEHSNNGPLSVSATVEVGPDRPTLNLSIWKNEDLSVSADLWIEISFSGGSSGFSARDIVRVPALILKTEEQDLGSPVYGVPIRVQAGLFWIASSPEVASRQSNLKSVQSSQWADIPFMRLDGSWAVLTFPISGSARDALEELLRVDARSQAQ